MHLYYKREGEKSETKRFKIRKKAQQKDIGIKLQKMKGGRIRYVIPSVPFAERWI